MPIWGKGARGELNDRGKKTDRYLEKMTLKGLVTSGFKGCKISYEQNTRIGHARSKMVNNTNSSLLYQLELFSLFSLSSFSDGTEWATNATLSQTCHVCTCVLTCENTSYVQQDVTQHDSNVAEELRKWSKTRMWANAQRDGRPAEHRWRPLFNAAKFGWRPLLDAVQ